MKYFETWIFICLLAGSIVVAGCDDDDDDDDEDNLSDVGQPCNSEADCYPGILQTELSGDVVCMDRVEDGYCTHYCENDADCCALDGECDDEWDLEYVCAPFESTGEYYCFISCEDAEDEENYCQTYAHPEFGCRSTGGGTDNRKVCMP